ncbi:MAG TPA: hypothetical protein VN706_04925 [Gemmatimonadaceae bacterium]|nr:hypothetical protein [Gemmatimonadaceae bacterium]
MIVSRYWLGIAAILAHAARGRAQRLDTVTALAGLADAEHACRVDAGTLWGRSLCGPIALADRQTRIVVANDTVPRRHYLPYGSAFVTTLPDGQFVANTAFKWGDRTWTMVALPLPSDHYDRVRLVMHEVFHREQSALGLNATDALNNHLDFREGRTWLRLEYRALAAALSDADTATMRRDAEGALLFRFARRAKYPGADSTEALLEMQEGLPEYTGHVLAMRELGVGRGRVAQHVLNFERTTPSFVRGFAYGTGPALGLLLDEFAPDWRTRVARERDLTAMLAQAIHFRPPRDIITEARRRAPMYGFADIDRAEAARDSTRAPMMRDFTDRFVNGRVITLHQTRDSLRWGYDPNSLIAFDRQRVVYPFGNFGAPWGSLDVSENGVLVANDFSSIVVSLPPNIALAPDARRIEGSGWVLNVNPGWVIVADPKRPGSFVVARQ